MSEWKVIELPEGGHRVLHHDHAGSLWSEAGTFAPTMALGDVIEIITERAEDGDFILLPDGSPIVLLDVPEEGSR